MMDSDAACSNRSAISSAPLTAIERQLDAASAQNTDYCPQSQTDLKRRIERLEKEVVQNEANAIKVPALQYENDLLKSRNKELKAQLFRLEPMEERNVRLQSMVTEMRTELQSLRKEINDRDRTWVAEGIGERLELITQRLKGEGQSFVPDMDEFAKKYRQKSRELELLQQQRAKDLSELEATRRELMAERTLHAETKMAIEPQMSALADLLNDPPPRAGTLLEHCKAHKQQLSAVRTGLIEIKTDTTDMFKEASTSLSDLSQTVARKVAESLKTTPNRKTKNGLLEPINVGRTVKQLRSENTLAQSAKRYRRSPPVKSPRLETTKRRRTRSYNDSKQSPAKRVAALQ